MDVKGYTKQSAEAVALVNRGKELEERVLRWLDEIEECDLDYDQLHALYNARSNIMVGFMWGCRTVFNPQRVDLPEDGPVIVGGNPNVGE